MVKIATRSEGESILGKGAINFLDGTRRKDYSRNVLDYFTWFAKTKYDFLSYQKLNCFYMEFRILFFQFRSGVFPGRIYSLHLYRGGGKIS